LASEGKGKVVLDAKGRVPDRKPTIHTSIANEAEEYADNDMMDEDSMSFPPSPPSPLSGFTN